MADRMLLWSILLREIVSCSFWKARKSDWGEICVAIDARSSVFFFPPHSRIATSLIANYFLFSSSEPIWTFCKKVCGVHSIESHANYLIFFVYVYPKLQLLFSSSKISSTPCSVDEHGVSIDAFAIRIEPPSQGRYLMKRQSHLRIAISNSARQRRTRGRVGGRSRGRGRRSRDKIIKTPLPRFVLKR